MSVRGFESLSLRRVEAWQSGDCSGLEHRRPLGPVGSNPTASAHGRLAELVRQRPAKAYPGGTDRRGLPHRRPAPGLRGDVARSWRERVHGAVTGGSGSSMIVLLKRSSLDDLHR